MTKKKIIFSTASPSGISKIHSLREFSTIQEIFQTTGLKNRFTFEMRPCTTPDDIIAFSKENPWMIHFAVHGDDSGRLIFDHNKNRRKGFALEIYDLKDILNDITTLQVIFFNACNTEAIVNETQKIIDYSIGFEGPVDDIVCIDFATRFYKHLENAESIYYSYKRTQRDMELSLSPNFKSMFKYKYLYEMKQQIAHSQNKNFIIDEQQEIAELINVQEVNLKTVIEDSLNGEPFDFESLWLFKNKDKLQIDIANQLLPLGDEFDQENLADELDIIFDFLVANLSRTTKGYSKQDIASDTYTETNIPLYPKALDLLIKKVPGRFSEDFKEYFTDQVNYIKSILPA